jgi:hypothetical protein
MLSVAGNSLGPRSDACGYSFKQLASTRFRTDSARGLHSVSTPANKVALRL